MPIERNQEAANASPETHGFVGSFLQTAAYESLQAPIKGVAQIVDQASGSTKLAKSLTFMEAPVKAEFNSAGWYGQQFGSAGKLVPFIAAYAVTHKAFGAAGLTAELKAGAESASKLLGKNLCLIDQRHTGLETNWFSGRKAPCQQITH